MRCQVTKYESAPAVAELFAQTLAEMAQQAKSESRTLTVSLSGGSTPKRLFENLAENYANVDWSSLHFFWGDERCVGPDDPESNFGEANRLFLQPAAVPAASVHRVLGEIDPQQAARQYEAEIKQYVQQNAAGWPVFDLMLLGMGDDGHTASIFPHQMELLDSPRWCDVAQHPDSGQHRVTLTGDAIRPAARICFLITGEAKADVLAEILNQRGSYQQYPTSHLCDAANVEFHLDQAAASKLKD